MTIVTCLKGHPQDRPDARFCKTCGAKIEAAALNVPNAANGVCVNGHPQVRASAKFCYTCGGAVNLRPSQQLIPHPLNGVCAKGHPQIRRGARFCYSCGAAVSPLGTPSRPIPQGPLINGRYAIKGELGRGGMGSVVYKVEDVKSPGQLYALKEIDETQLQPVSDRPEIIRSFQREADLLRRLGHPHIVKVHDSFQIGVKHYMVMDLVQGKALEDLLAISPGGFPESRVLPWAEQLCDTLGYLHSQTPPIIYRDVKPANVMIEDVSGQIKMLDFGIAREFKGGKKKSDTIRFGTEGYAPPEQYGGKGTETSPASDIYALGAMLHQLLSGKDPAQNPFQFDFLILSRPPISCSTRMINTLKKALDMNPNRRFQTMAEFSQAITGRAPAKSPAPKKSSSPAASPGPADRNHPLGTGTPPIPLPKVAPSSATGTLQLSMSHIDIGPVEKNGVPPRDQSFTVTTSRGGDAQVITTDSWLAAVPNKVSSGGLVKVSIKPQHLKLSGRRWPMRNVIKPLIRQAKRVPNQGWALAALVLLIGIAVRPIWQGTVLIVGGLLGVQLAGWLVSFLLSRAVVLPTAHTGQVIVDDGSTQKMVAVQIKAVPPRWRFMLGWLALIVVVSAEVLAVVIGLLWAVQQLGQP